MLAEMAHPPLVPPPEPTTRVLPLAPRLPAFARRLAPGARRSLRMAEQTRVGRGTWGQAAERRPRVSHDGLAPASAMLRSALCSLGSAVCVLPCEADLAVGEALKAAERRECGWRCGERGGSGAERRTSRGNEAERRRLKSDVMRCDVMRCGLVFLGVGTRRLCCQHWKIADVVAGVANDRGGI
ncbi:hypothetical protein CLOP_g15350 [Closterium sp. NIES-67]|nr:hypothetical protein CLOP_g15350 [Closterium sp. NIES-67]